MTIGKVGNSNVIMQYGPTADVAGVDAGSVSAQDLLRSLLASGYDPGALGRQTLNLGPSAYLRAPAGSGESRTVIGPDGTPVVLPSLEQRYAQEGGFAGTQGNDAIATSLHNEVLGDGQANCLERAMGLAGPNDSVLLLDDTTDDSGHAVVKHPDGSVTDPNNPDKRYASVADYLKQNPRYADPIEVKKTDLDKVLSLPPGAEREKMIAQLGLEKAADRMVADPGSGDTTYDLANAIANAPTYSPTELALLSKIKDPEQRAIQELQMQMQKQALLCTVITNLANMRHEMLKAVAQNLRS